MPELCIRICSDFVVMECSVLAVNGVLERESDTRSVWEDDPGEQAYCIQTPSGFYSDSAGAMAV